MKVEGFGLNVQGLAGAARIASQIHQKEFLRADGEARLSTP
jgi:hypothetical protein